MFEFPPNRVVNSTQLAGGANDKYGPVLITFTAKEISHAIPGYIAEVEGVHYPLDVQIYSNYSEDLERKLDSYRLRGEFSVGMYSYDVGLGGYKVRRNLDPDRWDVLQLEPMRTGPQPSEVAEFWLADCTRPVLFKHLLCTVQTSFRGHAVFFNLIDQNLRLKESVSSLVRHELESAYREAAR